MVIGHSLALAADDLFDILRSQWLDIGAVGKLRIGHDRGWIGIDQHYLVAFGFKRFAGLGSGVVKLRRLTNHYWS